jgi:hypothetical protein
MESICQVSAPKKGITSLRRKPKNSVPIPIDSASFRKLTSSPAQPTPGEQRRFEALHDKAGYEKKVNRSSRGRIAACSTCLLAISIC